MKYIIILLALLPTLIFAQDDNPATNPAQSHLKIDRSGQIFHIAPGTSGQVLSTNGTTLNWKNQVAGDVGATDAGGYYTGTNLEVITQEIGAKLPDTIIMQLPLHEYTGNAADTIASGDVFYFSPITQAMANRKIAKLEVSTTKEVDQDLGFWLWSEDIENSINTVVLPIAPSNTRNYFVDMIATATLNNSQSGINLNGQQTV